ncbi:MAG: hypothetical protein RMM53_04260 [Bacteroidia bacterium]|nr:hypothetical protein [Bacteroidia bacterium]MDW8333411.1 hypothetical protein [Bacteroidia bacterium]
MNREKFFRTVGDIFTIAAMVVWFVVLPYEVVTQFRARVDLDRAVLSAFGWVVYGGVLLGGRCMADYFRDER